MCTLGVIPGRFIFKTRDLWTDSCKTENCVKRRALFDYMGIESRAYPGEKGLNSGINSAGISVAITFVDQISLESALKTKTPRGVLVEDILGHCSNVHEALSLYLKYYDTPLVGGNIVISGRTGGVTIEQIYSRSALEWHTTEPVVCTNHFLNLTMVNNFDHGGSNARWKQMKRLLEKGSNDISSIKRAVSDHHGDFPVCSHDGNLKTNSAVIYDLHNLSMHYHYGPPCKNNWETESLLS